jgi:Fuc2NAc and GlcNAc transferase
MLSSSVLIVFAFSTILSSLSVGLVLPILNNQFLDNPNQRSSHIKPTPRGGGISFVLIGTLLNFVTSAGPSKWIPVICLPLAAVGLIDDFKGLPSSVRYAVQLITSSVLVAISHLSIPFWSSLLLIVLITAIINFTNFMDGLDGLVAGCAVLMMASVSSWAMSGAILGFLIWNWSPAKVFMGDVGSTFIGAVFGGMLLQTSSYHEFLHILLIGFPLFCDSFFCVIRRFTNGENIFKAHRKHLFQRLQQAGWKHQAVSALYISAVALLQASYKIIGISGLLFMIFFQFLIAVYLDRKVAVRFLGS